MTEEGGQASGSAQRAEALTRLSASLRLGERLDVTALSALSHVLNEALSGARLQQVRDPERGSIALKLRVPSQTYYLTLQGASEGGALRLSQRRPSTLPSPTGLGRWVRAHLEGTQLRRVWQVAGDRALAFEFEGKAPPGDEPARGGRLYLELIPTLYNLYAVDRGGVLRAWATRVAARGLHLGRVWSPPAQPEGFQAPELPSWPALSAEEARALLASLFSGDGEGSGAQVGGVALGETGSKTKLIKQSRARLDRLISALNGDLERAERAEEWRQQAELLKSRLGELRRGMRAVTVTNWFDPDLKELEVPLDPTRDGKENMERLFQKHRKALRGAEIAMERLIDAEERRARLEELIEEHTEGSFEELRGALRAAGLLKERAQRAARDAQERKPYRVFWSAQGEVIWVGRGGQDNHVTSFQCARGQDLWMHTRDAPGAHVIIPLPRKGHEPHLETLRDAAALAVHHSPLRGERSVELYFTERKHIRPIPGAPPGKVMVAASKTFTALEVESRIARLYDEARRRGPLS